MTNYNQVNIYRKQMQELGLNTKQYAKLINMPYEVVKDIIYDKEGEYSMEIKNLLRKNMMNKHQEIENDYDNAKIKAMEIKRDIDKEIDYIDWYNKVYDWKTLKMKLKVSSMKDFMSKYCLITQNKKASEWTYQILCYKKEYPDHHVDPIKKQEFIEQLYDIIENDNAKFYKSRKVDTKTIINKQAKVDLRKWFKKFDIKEWKKQNNVSNEDLCYILGIAYTTASHLSNKSSYSIKTLEKLYAYVNAKEIKVEYKPTIENKEEIEVLDEDDNNATTILERNDTTDTQRNDLTSDIIDDSTSQIELDNYNNVLLRKILISRLTDEEKMLIELFGGKIC
jgi:transcriptional regulator with XRE-family HTH domain